MSLPFRARFSLAARMVVALLFVGAISLTIAATAALAIGMVVMFTLVVTMAFVFGIFVPGDALAGLWPPSTAQFLGGALSSGALFVFVRYRDRIRNEIRAFEAELGCAGQRAEERHPKINSMARGLAQQANVPAPSVRIVNRRRPETYAVANAEEGTIVITRGVIRELDDGEIEAVIAHEVSHLANNDARIMRWLLVPMLLAEHIGSGGRPTLGSGRVVGRPSTEAGVQYTGTPLLQHLLHLAAWTFFSAVSSVQVLLSQFGVALFSRGREVAADTGAARLTGSPATLASALRKLDGARSRPTEDKREFLRTAGVLDILPVENRRLVEGPFRTHPATERRIAHLESLVEEMEV